MFSTRYKMEESEKPIQKKVLHAGKRNALEGTTIPEGTRVKFHFVAKLADQGDVLDDSRTWDKPMELILGKKFKLEVWETCLQTMTVGEVASFKVKPILTYSYPTVAKTLRDSFGHRGHKKCKEEKEKHGHMCSMMAMQAEGGLGYDDLNELMKVIEQGMEPKALEFVIELLQVDLPDEYQKESWQMDPEEKLGSVAKLKEEGNNLFKEGKLEDAAKKYADAIGRLEQLMLREKPHDTEWLQLRDQKVPLLLNYSQCKLGLNEFYPVIEHCTEVLEFQPDNVKALYRRARAHAGAWNPTDAKSDFERVAHLDKSLAATCCKEIKRIEEMEKQKNFDDREKFKALFKA